MKLTPAQLHEILQRPAMRELNPLAGLPNPQRKPAIERRSQNRELEESPRSMDYCVTIISCRKKLVDAHDNLRTGAKPLVDAITASLGFASDDNPRLVWEYGQIVSSKPGTIVKVTKRS